ncbi:uncharacterized protein LOC122031932 [Zingiber officinale]|uniref:Uncharacterized protein n=1 Tax=Zingiber officinale TaxID=94328 RepID=A0A8J5EBD1_ZINOF|nr:uncharacterized protein LOC122031932 [Zingiber officinale]KAG6470252.1 hypothetical protein ZIOFF_071316 [Zingiber officinale]
MLVRFRQLTEAAGSAISVPPMVSPDGRTPTTGSKPLGLMANAAKRKQSFLQFFLMTGILMLSMRSLSQKYRVRDLSDENALLREERDAFSLRSSAVKEALFQEAALDPSGLLADHLRSLFNEQSDH